MKVKPVKTNPSSWMNEAFAVFEDTAKEVALAEDKRLSINILPDLPQLYDKQREILDDPAPRKVVNAGRQVGKTFFAARACLEEFFAGGRVLYCATTQEQSDAVWDYLYEWAIPVLRQYGVYVNESKRIIDGRRRGMKLGRIRVKTGSKPDVLRGEKANLLILDECAYLDAKAWQKVGAPMLATTKGRAIFISTPNRRNWFFGLYMRGVDPLDPDWKMWEFPSSANPFISEEAFAAMIADMSEEDIQQEVMAKFLENEGTVFRNIQACVNDTEVKPYASDFALGVDWGQQKDYTVISVIDLRTLVVVDTYRFNKLAWFDQRARIKHMYKKWNKLGKVHTILVELNSIGSPNAEALLLEGLPIQGFMMTGKSKPPLIEALALAFERGEIRIPDNAPMIAELMAYERKVSVSGRRRYSAPSGLHDDCVISLALVWFAATQQPIPHRSFIDNHERIGDY